MKIKKVLAFFFFCTVLTPFAWSYWVWSPEAGKFINTDKAVQDDAEEEYDLAMELYREENFDSAIKQLER